MIDWGVSIAVVWFLYLICYGSLPLYWSSSIYHLFREVLATAPSFWLLIVVVPIACVLPSFLCQEVSRCGSPAPASPPQCHPPCNALVPA